MKIITWNCNMAFRKKASIILEHKPDILVVPECEHPDRLEFADDSLKPKNQLWFGDNKHKGLGIFSYGNYKLKQLENYNSEIKFIAPAIVTNGRYKFILLAIWANNPADPDGPYVEQVWKAIHYYENHLSSKRTVLIGDFNSNTIWDKKRRLSNHSNVVKVLERKGIVSSYHLHYKQVQGKEEHPTQYMYRHRDKPYHLDYCFTSSDMAKKILSVEIGEYDYWTKYSDHVPVSVTFNLNRKLKKEKAEEQFYVQECDTNKVEVIK